MSVRMAKASEQEHSRLRKLAGCKHWLQLVADVAGQTSGFIGGVDPNMDPELAMAFQVSIEEFEAQERRAKAADESGAGAEGGEEKGDDGPAMNTEGEAADAAGPDASGPDADAGAQAEEDALLQQALAMSLGEGGVADDDDDLQRALRMSLEEAAGEAPPPTPSAAAEAKAAGETPAAAAQSTPAAPVKAGERQGGGQGSDFLSPAFVAQLLQGYGDVDPSHPDIQAALASINAAQQTEGKDDAEAEKDDEMDEGS